MQVMHFALTANLGKQPLIVFGGILDDDSDGVAVAIERAPVSSDISVVVTHRNPRYGSHIKVGKQQKVISVI